MTMIVAAKVPVGRTLALNLPGKGSIMVRLMVISGNLGVFVGRGLEEYLIFDGSFSALTLINFG